MCSRNNTRQSSVSHGVKGVVLNTEDKIEIRRLKLIRDKVTDAHE